MTIQQFEYKVVSKEYPMDLEDELNTLGKQGWELTSVTNKTYPLSGESFYTAFLKQPINDKIRERRAREQIIQNIQATIIPTEHTEKTKF